MINFSELEIYNDYLKSRSEFDCSKIIENCLPVENDFELSVREDLELFRYSPDYGVGAGCMEIGSLFQYDDVIALGYGALEYIGDLWIVEWIREWGICGSWNYDLKEYSGTRFREDIDFSKFGVGDGERCFSYVEERERTGRVIVGPYYGLMR